MRTYFAYLFIVSLGSFIVLFIKRKQHHETKYIVIPLGVFLWSIILLIITSPNENGEELADNSSIERSVETSPNDTDEASDSTLYSKTKKPKSSEILDVDHKYLCENHLNHMNDWVRVAGVVDSIDTDSSGHVDVILSGTAESKTIRCYLMEGERSSSLDIGGYATIVGIDNGEMNQEVTLKTCYIASFGERARAFANKMATSTEDINQTTDESTQVADSSEGTSTSLFGTYDMDLSEALYVTADAAHLEMEANQVACKTKYNGKTVVMNGVVDDIGTNLFGQEYVTLKTSNAFSGVQCFFKNDQMDYVATLSSGMSITLVGIADIGSMTFKMGNCQKFDASEGDFAESFASTNESAASLEPKYEKTDSMFDIVPESYGDGYRYSAFVEIENTGNVNIYFDDVTFDIEDSDGHLLQSEDFISDCPDLIKPGEKGYIYTYNDSLDVADVTGIQLTPHYTIKATTTEATDYDLSDVSIKEGQFGVTIVGRVTNNTSEDDSMVYLQAIFYDNSGKCIGITGTNVTDLNAGKTLSFEISNVGGNNDLTVSDIADYKVIARKTYYGY